MFIGTNQTIAIIDSGIGGVSVLKQLIKKYKAGNYIYFADNLFLPYGNKSKTIIKKRIHQLIAYLQETYNAKYIIIACNTASSSIDELNNNVFTMKFKEELTYFATKLTKKNLPNIKVIADNSLAKQIENKIFKPKELNRCIKRHIKLYQLSKHKQIVLGCTHYELAINVFKKHCPNTCFINNSEFLMQNLSFKFASNDVNFVIKMSKNDYSLENKILKILKGE